MFNKFSLIYFGISGLLFAVGKFTRSFAHDPDFPLLAKIPFVIATLLAFFVAGSLFYLALVPISRLHTVSTALGQFVTLLFLYFGGWFLHVKQMKATKNVRKTQDDVLMHILKKNNSTKFGKKFNFAKIKNRDQYRQALKLTTYSDYEEYIDRMAKGDDNVLTTDRLIKFCASSGTTGKPKLIPFGESLTTSSGEAFVSILYQSLKKRSFLRKFAPLKYLDIKYAIRWRYTEAGTPIGFASTLTKNVKPLDWSTSTPPETIAIMNEPAQSYIHLLFALIDGNLAMIASVFGGPMVVMFEFLQKNWVPLADDIRLGRISNLHGIPPEVIANVERHPAFKANPQRAAQIEAACSKGFKDVATRIWPNLDTAYCVITGAHSIYVDRLRYFVGSKVNIVSPTYGASEGTFGFALTPNNVSSLNYSLHVRGNFYEFIPESDIFSDNPRVLFADELEVDKRYEIVITTQSGLYRYRMGDVVSVAGFYNQSPIIEFKTRVGGILDLRGEKTTEDMMNTALKGALRHWEGCSQMVDYTVTDSVSLQNSLESTSKFVQNFELGYVIFVELDGVSRSLTTAEVDAFDDSLSTVHDDYNGKRAAKMIAKPKIFVVQTGTFKELQVKIMEKNSSASNQYKTPRYQKNAEFLRFLVERAYE